MKILFWGLRLAAFLLVFGLAIKNGDLVQIRFFFDRALNAPLSLVILVTFAVGVLIGISATLSTLLRQRRHISRLNRAAAHSQEI